MPDQNMWKYRGQERPSFAIQPGPGQESVWDYPRPPAYVDDPRPVRIEADGALLAQAKHAIRALETGSPPAFYLPPSAFDQSLLRPSSRKTYCEWKGEAQYFDVITPARTIEAAVWCYPEPKPGAERSLVGIPVIRSSLNALWAMRPCRRRPEPITAVGSPPSWSAPGKASPAPGTGDVKPVIHPMHLCVDADQRMRPR